MKKTLSILLIASIIVSTLASFSHQIEAETPSLVGYWRFDEGTGTVASDSSGNGNTGTLINGPRWVYDVSGMALSFDGIDDYVSIPDSSSLDIGGDQVSIEFWMKPTVDLPYTRQNMDIYDKGDAYTSAIHLEAGDPNYGKYEAALQPAIIYSTTDFWDSDTWYYLALTYDGNNMRLYVNGVLENTVARTGNIRSTSYPLSIGSYTLGTFAFFEGTLDEFAIYNYARTPEEIRTEYERTRAIAWASTTSLPAKRSGQPSVAYDERIYVLGGRQVDTVYYCSVNPNGTIDSWHSTTSLPDDRWQTVALAYGGYVYFLGGESSPGPTWQSEVWYAEIQADGSLSAWLSTTSLPRGMGGHGGFEWNGRLYVLGGWTGYGFRRETYFAEVQPDASLGSWTSTSLLPEARGHGIAAVAHNGYAYALGGQGSDLADKADVWYAKINSDGTIDPWASTTSMPIGLESHAVAVVEDEIYVIGGLTHPPWTERSEVYRAPINPDGTLGAWTRDTDLALPISIEPRGHLYNQAPVVNDRIYIIGGRESDTEPATDTVYYTSTVEAVEAIVDIDPDTLNLKGKGRWITAYIELPEGYDVNDINVSTILLNDTVPAELHPTEVGDYDEDGIPDLMVKFDRDEVISLIESNLNTRERVCTVTLTITGKLYDGTRFQGRDSIRVLIVRKGDPIPR